MPDGPYPGGAATFVQEVGSGPVSGTSTTLTLQPTGRGDLLVLAVAHSFYTSVTDVKIRSDGGALWLNFCAKEACGAEIDVFTLTE